jgi:hypothetical protein
MFLVIKEMLHKRYFYCWVCCRLAHPKYEHRGSSEGMSNQSKVSASRDGMQCKLAFPSPGGLIAPLFIKRAPGTTKPNLAQSSAELDDAGGASGVHGRQFKGLGSHFEATSPVFTARCIIQQGFRTNTDLV